MRMNRAWKITLSGQREITGGPYVIVANHQSQVDSVAMCFLRGHHFKCISKAILFHVPFLGWHLRFCRHISLVRGDKESIAKCMETAATWIRRGVSVLFFPEGTRSPDGVVRAFKLGAFRLAAETGARVLPITISGTDRVLPKGGWVITQNAHIHVHVGESLDPPCIEDVESFAERVREQIVARKRQLDQLRDDEI